jgi:hypothetical protein
MKMSQSKWITTMFKSTPHLAILTLTLACTYFTLGLRVRRTRQAFEKQVIAQGMSKEDAKQLSACFDDLKNNITTTVKQGLASGAFR